MDPRIALNSWESWDALTGSFRSIGHTEIRFKVAGRPVDIIPFGSIEAPPRINTPKGEGVIVFGVGDVHSTAIRLKISPDTTVRLPTPTGYTALKSRATVTSVVGGAECALPAPAPVE